MFRILPRIGSSAWYEEDRARRAVPSAESPSTINSSECSTFPERQSTSLVGIDEDSRAVLRRCASLCTRAEMRVFISETTFSHRVFACALSARPVACRRALSWSDTTFSTICRTAGVPRISLVCPSNCGSARRTVSTAVNPASASSFSILSLPTLNLRALSARCLRKVRSSPCSNPVVWVPPLGVAIILTKLRIVVSYPIPQRRAISTSHSRSTSVSWERPSSPSTGTVSVNEPRPVNRQISVTALSCAKNSTNSLMPPSC